jgi:hypothetical protein
VWAERCEGKDEKMNILGAKSGSLPHRQTISNSNAVRDSLPDHEHMMEQCT